MTLDDLAHEIRSGVLGAKGALTQCARVDCPLVFGKIEVTQEIKHHLNRIDRAMRVYVSYQEFGVAESTPDNSRNGD